MSIIMHVDFNSYFASVEQQANPFLRDKAIGVGGKPGTRSVVTTASTQAKQRGVKTAMSSWEATNICPELQMINGDPRKYSEITDRFMTILSRYSPKIMQTSVDEAFVDLTEQTDDWMGAIGIALNIKQDLAKEVGTFVTVSIGLANNTLMAKIAGESKKPNGLTIVQPDQYLQFLSERSLDDIPGIGRHILRHLEELGISTTAQLQLTPLPLLIKEFKQYGLFLFQASRGIGSTVLDTDDHLPKSISHSYTLPQDLSHPFLVRGTFLQLCECVAYKLRFQHLVARSFSVIYRSDARVFSSKQACFDKPTQDGIALFSSGWPYLVQYLQQNRLRLVGIRVTNLVPEHQQLSTNKKEQKYALLLPALDKLTEKFGQHAWTRAAALSPHLHERTSGWHFDHKA
ncbi:hypothetical protein COV06_02485 [Candidatus Uhrbacteria bacterium CG10_big_fil_rev_8_21_14_0_10_50_16]|uniref:DNA-directed DNA polymerase n=1 Tax=Candidatus Uhrbacteria bacterium CG10_big_fil_rev_8_21_14_0_10_50_16 TaxID=1975039 RepID=A0A2H0RM83_9BACT|nr:MAG: hypothetical protein COV06_02485 [Candidatus Uhrbacteria bacterium CG10_big_fil_rev_8_21_14_0_10_50_16]